jgi:hypothetical protein
MTRSRSVYLLLVLAGWSLFASSASATVIQYQQVFQSGNHYEYSYSITNDESFDIYALTIFFEVGSYANLAITSSPADWDPLAIQPDMSLSADGFVDWQTFMLPLLPSQLLMGFNVGFDWIGSSANPFASQYFEIYDVESFDVLASGNTLRDMTVDVPESSGLTMLIIALGLLRLTRRKSSTNA